MKLHEWAILYMKNKDAFEKKLQGVEESGDVVTLSYTDHTLPMHVMELLEPLDIEGKALIVTLQTKRNVARLVSEWSSFSTKPDLTIVFANPDKNEHWSLKPFLHERIRHGDLATGVHGMASHVTYA